MRQRFVRLFAGAFALGASLSFGCSATGGVRPAAVEASSSNVTLVLQITVDGLRGDLLRRYGDRFGEGGFRFLLEEGAVLRQRSLPARQHGDDRRPRHLGDRSPPIGARDGWQRLVRSRISPARLQHRGPGTSDPGDARSSGAGRSGRSGAEAISLPGALSGVAARDHLR